MLKVLTAAQMREVDRLTTERFGIPSILLMENAAQAVAAAVREKLGGSVAGKSVVILCGPGNNGGDGAALARILWKDGAFVVPLLFGRVEQTKNDASINFRILKSFEEQVSTSGGSFNKLLLHDEDEDLVRLLGSLLSEPEPIIVIDALFGTGLQRELSGKYADVIQRLEDHKPTIISIDVPSGLNADSGRLGRNITADTTVTFTAPKVGNVVAPAAAFNGELIVANIGSPQELIDDQPSQTFLAERSDAVDWLKLSAFANGSYKNKRGHALIIAGSRNYSGAAVLAGNAGIRSGVGLVTLAVPEDSRDGVIARVSPEVIVRGLSQTSEGSAAEIAADEVAEFLENVDAVAIGSGLSSKDDETKNFIRRVVTERKTPVLIDADGLTALSPWDTQGSNDLPLLLTPHEGEFKRLLGVKGSEADDKLRDRVDAVREFATKFNVILVLKGERALIGSPDGRVVINPTGNAGLGKAGNGDTLTGIIVGFSAQAIQIKIDMFETVAAAVYVAGMAGDDAERRFGKRVMTASDVRDSLVSVFEDLGQDLQ